MKTEINYNGVPLTVITTTTQGMRSGDYDTPDDADTITLDSVMVGNADITGMLTEEQITEILNLI